MFTRNRKCTLVIIFLIFGLFVFNYNNYVSASGNDYVKEYIQLLQLAANLQEKIARYERKLIQLKESALLPIEQIKNLRNEIAKEVNETLKFKVYIDTDVLPTAKKLMEKLPKFEKIIERSGVSFKAFEENIQNNYDDALSLSETMSDLFSDLSLKINTNQEEYIVNSRKIFEDLDMIAATCGDGEHGNNCHKQLLNRLRTETRKETERHVISGATSRALYGMFVQDLHDRKTGAIETTLVATQAEEHMEAYDNMDDFTLSPKIVPRD